MWLVKNSLRATLTLRGLGISIAAGEQFDLDALGRDLAETSNQVQVAFEEGYLENVYKAPRGEGATDAPTGVALGGRQLSSEELEGFKKRFMAELKETLPSLAQVANQAHLEQVRKAISTDVQAVVGELKLLRDRIESEKGRIKLDPKLSDADVKARLAFLEEQERALLKNFETIGRQHRAEDGDVMDKADLLSNL